jgi:hypothetical protein
LGLFSYTHNPSKPIPLAVHRGVWVMRGSTAHKTRYSIYSTSLSYKRLQLSTQVLTGRSLPTLHSLHEHFSPLPMHYQTVFLAIFTLFSAIIVSGFPMDDGAAQIKCVAAQHYCDTALIAIRPVKNPCCPGYSKWYHISIYLSIRRAYVQILPACKNVLILGGVCRAD